MKSKQRTETVVLSFRVKNRSEESDRCPDRHFCLLRQFAGTLSDGLGKTMDNRHQTEREYIRYCGATSGEHLVAGIHGLAHGEPANAESRQHGRSAGS